MENFVITNPYIHWPLFVIGVFATTAPIPFLMITSPGKAFLNIPLFICSVWFLIDNSFHFFPIMGIILLFFFMAGIVTRIIDSGSIRQNLYSNLFLIFAFFCGIYSINAFWAAQTEQTVLITEIKQAAAKEKQFKDNTNERAMCKGLDFKKYKADGGDPATIDKCQKLLSEKPLSQQTKK